MKTKEAIAMGVVSNTIIKGGFLSSLFDAKPEKKRVDPTTRNEYG